MKLYVCSKFAVYVNFDKGFNLYIFICSYKVVIGMNVQEYSLINREQFCFNSHQPSIR